ncbi:putative tRNA-splicing endonuclease subunit tsp-5 [Golovinomyces cichoracearum]|uniref:Putative tRNA-splicing endonuclease subunit tsp-5 n=1 Tax=Golovinomyces cichoracearum TaxID=62708 RepID=A0A420IHT1_9PEZI|nr:putative tRNA-splicing endonuclease subunit tsp-5 [Golovinomyces cichoracearum]
MEFQEEDDLSIGQEFQSYEEDDPTDEILDFRFANSASVKSGGQLPKRGEKDFEQHGTKNQESLLESSRKAMYDALAHVRSHTPKNHIRGFYYGDTGQRIILDEIFDHEARNGLQEDHVVLVESVKGPHFKTIGKMTTKQKIPSLWLLPEEALYLVERGFLDLWWPPEKLDTMKIPDEDGENDEGTPMSLQAAYALLIGDDNEKGKISMDRYTVYGNLRRTGYVVQRAPDLNIINDTKTDASFKASIFTSPETLFAWLFGSLFSKKNEHHNYGPLVLPGMYRSYNSIYQNLAVIPKHKPMLVPSDSALDPEFPYRVVFYLWKGDNLKSFTKKNPGNPDFRIAIVDAHSVPIPSLSQMTALLNSTPFNPPDLEKLGGPGKIYQRLKHGWRNLILAVVDQGVISYLKLVEGAFGEEIMYQRFDKSGLQGTKRGYRGRGRGRGR